MIFFACYTVLETFLFSPIIFLLLKHYLSHNNLFIMSNRNTVILSLQDMSANANSQPTDTNASVTMSMIVLPASNFDEVILTIEQLYGTNSATPTITNTRKTLEGGIEIEEYIIAGNPTAYYQAMLSATDEGNPYWGTPLICRADNGMIVVIEDNTQFENNLDSFIGSSLATPIFLENLSMNNNGCTTLDIYCDATLPAATPLYCNLMYYIPSEGSSPNTTWISQSFPLERFDFNHFRLGFKAFCNPFEQGNAASEDYYTGVIPRVWITFNEISTLGN